MEMDFIRMGRRIKDMRRQKKWSQEKLAEEASMSVPYLSQIENGKKKASLEALVKISNALGISMDILIDGSCRITVGGNTEFDFIIHDCTIYEKKVLMESMVELKRILRENSSDKGSKYR